MSSRIRPRCTATCPRICHRADKIGVVREAYARARWTAPTVLIALLVVGALVTGS